MGGPSGAGFASCMTGSGGSGGVPEAASGSGAKRDRDEEIVAGGCCAEQGHGHGCMRGCVVCAAVRRAAAAAGDAQGVARPPAFPEAGAGCRTRASTAGARRHHHLTPPCLVWYASGAADEDDGSDGGAGGKGKGRACKKGKGAADAASVKATREKARREKLNEWCAPAAAPRAAAAAAAQQAAWALLECRQRGLQGSCRAPAAPPLRPPPKPCSALAWPPASSFDELARLCDPSGKMVKTDRISIVQGGWGGRRGSGVLAGCWPCALGCPARSRVHTSCARRPAA